MSDPPSHSQLLEAAERLLRVDNGESIESVYPDSGGGECSTTLVDTEMLCSAWIDEHIHELFGGTPATSHTELVNLAEVVWNEIVSIPQRRSTMSLSVNKHLKFDLFGEAVDTEKTSRYA